MLKDENITYKHVIDYLKSLSPSGVELEFISLSAMDYSKKDIDIEKSMNVHIQNMLEVFEQALMRHTDSDFVHACLNNFLKTHYEIIVEDSILSEFLEKRLSP